MIRYLRLWRQFAITAFIREAEYRMNFVIGVGEGVAQLALAVLSFWLLFRFTDQVAGWTQAEVLMLVGVYRIADGLISVQIAPNMRAITGYIRRGEMDFILLRPVSSQFLVSLRTLDLPEAANVLIGLLLVIYAGGAAGVRWSPMNVLAAGTFGLIGLALLYTLWFVLMTFSFWLVQVDNLDTFFYSLFETARYPVVFFKGLLRALLTFVLPVAFATTFPAEALRGKADLRLLPVGVAL
ncbi:MAG TPA: ABC-2 family transporter protein, partial [Roseiflexaceae bacterium]|nr:ABC-2 family transporter protein [Roseiflexaceae bacterium]